MESARPARAGDRDDIVALADMVVRELEPTRGGAVWQRRESRVLPVDASIDDDLRSATTGPDAAVAVFVGTIDEVVVGYGVIRREALRTGEDLGVVTDIYVQPEARGIGVGEAIMDLIVEWATAQGCIGVDSIALPGNRATKNFFERFGLVARAIVVHRSLLPAADGAPDAEVQS